MKDLRKGGSWELLFSTTVIYTYINICIYIYCLHLHIHIHIWLYVYIHTCMHAAVLEKHKQWDTVYGSSCGLFGPTNVYFSSSRPITRTPPGMMESPSTRPELWIRVSLATRSSRSHVAFGNQNQYYTYIVFMIIYIYIFKYAYIYIYMYDYVCIYIYVYFYVFIYMYIFMYIYTYIYIYMCICMFM